MKLKLLIANKNKIDTYSLPDKVEESFLIKYISIVDNEEKIISLNPEENKWRIDNNVNISLFDNNAPCNYIIIEKYKTYRVRFNDVEEDVYIHCVPCNEKYKDYSSQDKIIVGGGSGCNIIYNSVFIEEVQLELTMDSDYKWNIKLLGGKQLVYVNNVTARNQVLNYGDTIFISGLKIIPMKGYIRVNSTDKITVVGLNDYEEYRVNNTDYKEETAKERNMTLYKEEEYFFHTPSLKPKIETEEIEIDNPPQKKENDEMPMFLSLGMFLTFCVSSIATMSTSFINIATGKSTIGDEIITIIVSIAMLIGSVLFPALISLWQKKNDEKKEQKRLTKYQEYLNGKKKLIDDTIEKQTIILNSMYLSGAQCKEVIMNKQNLWSREIQDNDFLALRLGIGEKDANIEVDIQRQGFSIDDDILRDKLKEIQEAKLTMNDVPITVSLSNDNVFGSVLTCENKKEYIDNIMVQLMSYYSSYDLKIVFLVNKKNSYIWDNYKMLTHSVSSEKDIRFFAYDEDDMKNVSSYLTTKYQERIDMLRSGSDEASNMNKSNEKEYYKNFNPYYLIITDDIIHTKNIEIINKIIDDKCNYGFSLLIFENSIKNLPSRCNVFSSVNNEEAILFNKEQTIEGEIHYKPEFLELPDINKLVYCVSNIPVASDDQNFALPQTLEFLEMYKVGKIEQLNVQNRWKNNDPTMSLNVPIGVRANRNLFELDLHEKNHGPHGLIAGMTGSGKSEFIITYILSMCVNFSPEEVQFVLIDYKGGGLAGAFENKEKNIKIPHLVGTITNLDKSEIIRSLVSIQSELKRRQRLFNEARDKLGESTMDIYKYQKYYREKAVDKPMSHLFIISDEFAELKAQQPDFMDELVSTARIGRSLGVHLILATQKPSGVVDDQIWSNAKFKVCLKVQSISDSQEMLRRTEAAYIKEAGRFYLQVGNDELFELGQSAWSGAKYIPSDVIEKKIDDSIDFINDSGVIIKKVNNEVKKDETKDEGEQLTNIVKYLLDLSEREHLDTGLLWLPSIPDKVYLGNLLKKYNYHNNPQEYTAIIGEYDDPENQHQGLLTQNMAESGNTIIYGTAGCGKENQIITMLYSLMVNHSSKELNVYIMDFGSEVLRVFNQMPHVGDYITVNDKEKLDTLFKMLNNELKNRKELFSQYGGSFNAYNSSSKEKKPLIIVVLNGYESFTENFYNYEDGFASLVRECSKFGIVFINTVSAPNGIMSRISQNFDIIYGMRFVDSLDYRFLLNATPGLVPKNVPGRGVTSINGRGLEYQSAYINVTEQINQTLLDLAKALTESGQEKATACPVIPSIVNASTMSKFIKNLSNIPIGVEINNLKLASYNLIDQRINIITSNNINLSSGFVVEFLKLLTKVPNTTISLFDSLNLTNIPEGIPYTSSSDEFMSVICNVITKADQPLEQRIVIINGITELLDKASDELKNKFIDILNNINKYVNTNIVIIDNYENINSLNAEKWYVENVSKNDGIWIGEGIGNQVLIRYNEDEPLDDIDEYTYNMGYIVRDNKPVIVKFVSDEEE